MKKYIYILFKPNGDIENITPHLTSTEMRERQARRYYRTFCDGFEPNQIIMYRFLQYKDNTYNIHKFLPEVGFFDPTIFINESINYGIWTKLMDEALYRIKEKLEVIDLTKVEERVKLNHSRGRHYKRGGKKC